MKRSAPSTTRGAVPRSAAVRPLPTRKRRRWSRRVTRESNALDLEPGVFTLEPKSIARSLKRSAEQSLRRKSSPFRSAMSMLTFYINRAGRHLSRVERARLEAAKDELRALFRKGD